MFPTGAGSVRVYIVASYGASSTTASLPPFRVCTIDNAQSAAEGTCAPARTSAPGVLVPDRPPGSGLVLEQATSGSGAVVDMLVTFDARERSVTLIAHRVGAFASTASVAEDLETSIEFTPYRAGPGTADLSWQTGDCGGLLLATGSPVGPVSAGSDGQQISRADQQPPTSRQLHVAGQVPTSESYVKITQADPTINTGGSSAGCAYLTDVTLAVSFP